MRGYEELVLGWEEVLECLRDKETPDIDVIQHLIFDSYHYEKKEIKGDSVPRNRLKLYKLIGQFCQSLSENYPEGMTASLSETCEDFASGICYVIENAFDCGYGENVIPISLNRHVPVGCANPEADMTTYESFVKEFDENLEWLRDEYDEE